MITTKINTGQGTVGKLINDTTLYRQAAAGVTSMHDDADALKHNFLLRGFFKERGYANPAEVREHAVSQLPSEKPAKSFQYDPKSLFDKPDSARLKNQKSLNAAGQYLQSQQFGLAVIAASTGRTGDSDKELALSEARSFVVRKYLVENFPLDDRRLKTLGLGKSATASEGGSIEILLYAGAPAVARKAPAQK
jgi:outer membrane protein OmpA-like peptidoglycan-associated protein